MLRIYTVLNRIVLSLSVALIAYVSVLASRRWRYVHRCFLFVIPAAPYLSVAAHLRMSFTPEVLYFLRFIPPARGALALGIVVACSDATTGCAIYPVTPSGKAVSVVLAVMEMMMFPLFTVFITSAVRVP